MPDTIAGTARLWLFDVDGTLVAPSDDQLNAWVATFRLDTYTRHVRDGLAARPVRLLPGARDLLEFLQGRGELVGVVTGNFPAEGEPKLCGVGLLRQTGARWAPSSTSA